MENGTVILVGVAIGCTGGVAGGVYGTYRSISRARTPDARKMMVRLSVYAWLGISVFLALMFALPFPYRFLLWIPYGVALPLFIRYANKQEACSRAEAGEDV